VNRIPKSHFTEGKGSPKVRFILVSGLRNIGSVLTAFWWVIIIRAVWVDTSDLADLLDIICYYR